MREDVFNFGVKALIRNSAGDILVMRVNPEHLIDDDRSYHDLPGGRIERGESVQEALVREITEETGLTEFTIARSLGMGLSKLRIPQPAGDDIGLILGLFECQVAGEPQIQISDEHIQYEWVSPSRAAELLSIKFPPELCRVVGELAI